MPSIAVVLRVEEIDGVDIRSIHANELQRDRHVLSRVQTELISRAIHVLVLGANDFGRPVRPWKKTAADNDQKESLADNLDVVAVILADREEEVLRVLST